MPSKKFIETLFPHADKERQEREAAEREKPRLDPEVEERKLLAVLAEFEPVQPPPEISPTEAPAEVVKRLEALERQQPLSGAPPPAPRGDLQQRRNRALDALKRLRIEKATEAQAERNREHERRCSKQIAKLEGAIAEAESKRDAEQERHRARLAELQREHLELSEKLGALLRPLPPNETTEDRLRSLEAMA